VKTNRSGSAEGVAYWRITRRALYWESGRSCSDSGGPREWELGSIEGGWASRRGDL